MLNFQIQSFIKELGIDKFDAESFIVPDEETKKKKTKKADGKISVNATPLGNKDTPEQNTTTNTKKVRNPGKPGVPNSTKQELSLPHKPQNKKIVFDSEGPEQTQQTNQKAPKAKDKVQKLPNQEHKKTIINHGEMPGKKKEEVAFNQKPQNKKIMFGSEDNQQRTKNIPDKSKVNGSVKTTKNKDETKTVNTAANGNSATGAQQNKKIVFDPDYLEKSRQKNTPKNESKKQQDSTEDSWYKLLIRPDMPWYHQGKKLKSDDTSASPEDVRKCEIEGQRYLEDDSANFMKGKFFYCNVFASLLILFVNIVRSVGTDKSETRWLQTVLKSGTFADKIAAHTLLLQESPAHNLSSLKFLISLLDVKGRRECMTSLDALLGAFTSGKVLDPNAKLVPINKQPIAALSKVTPRERKELLALWSYQNQLKDYYNQFIVALDGLLKDAVEATRRKGISAVATMLAYCPEHEQGLLTRLINKIGDPTRAVATSAVGQLEKLLQKHSNMKTVVVAEVERLLYRPNINVKAQYYALCFLSQILLDEDDVSLAMKLIVIYVSFFKACVKKVTHDYVQCNPNTAFISF